MYHACQLIGSRAHRPAARSANWPAGRSVVDRERGTTQSRIITVYQLITVITTVNERCKCTETKDSRATCHARFSPCVPLNCLRWTRIITGSNAFRDGISEPFQILFFGSNAAATHARLPDRVLANVWNISPILPILLVVLLSY